MSEADESLSQGNDSAEVMESIGVDPNQAELREEPAEGSLASQDDPLAVKKRLGMQAKKHQRELRALQDQIMRMQSQMGQGQQASVMQQNQGQYAQDNPQGMSIEEQIQRGVRYALQAKDEQERRAKEAEQQMHVQKQYERLNNEFDSASDKYEDFDDVVRGHDAPYTPAIRDALLLIDNPADVAYKLGKDKDKLHQLSKLHPVDQAREVYKLSVALMNGNGGNGKQAAQRPNPMGNIKVNPATSQAVTDKTPPSVIRARMKAGTWK